MDAMRILGSLMGGGSMSSGLGGQLVGSLLGGGRGGSGGALGGLVGNALGGAMGGGRGRRGGGGLASILGSVAVAALANYATSASRGGGSLGGTGAASSGIGDLSGLLGLTESAPPPADANDRAEILVRAMIGAAKSDGRIDANEEAKILERLGDLDGEERDFVQRELKAPVDAAGLARAVPGGMEREVYAVSLLAIELDERAEAVYLHGLAQGLDLSADACNEIHDEIGAPRIY